MSAAPLAMFLTEFSRGPRAAPKERRVPQPAFSEEPAPFDPESDIGAEFDAPMDEAGDAAAEDFASLDSDASFSLGDDEADPAETEELALDGLEDATDLDEAEMLALPAPASEAELEAEDEAPVVPAEVEARHQAEIEALKAAQEEALVAARAEWSASEGERLASAFDAALAELRNTIDIKLAQALRPLLAAAIVTRVKTELIEVIDKLIGDSAQPSLRVRAPEDLLAVLKTARPDAPIEWVCGQSVEVTVTADGSTVESKLAAALADIAATEI